MHDKSRCAIIGVLIIMIENIRNAIVVDGIHNINEDNDDRWGNRHQGSSIEQFERG